MKIKKVDSDFFNEFDINLQLIAIELDCSVADLLYISKCSFSDSDTVYETFLEDVFENGIEVLDFDGNTHLYEYKNENLILFENLGEFTIIFSRVIKDTIINVIKDFSL